MTNAMGRTRSKKPVVPLKSKLKKDPGVPRLPDLKVKNAAKQLLNGPKPPPQRPDDDSIMASEPTLSSLARLASETIDVTQDPSSSTSGGKTKEQMRKHYVRTLHKVIDESDIVILVLDARDPEGCRSRLVEEEVRRREGEGKKLVFVLNKVDLIPKDNAQLWLKHLRHSTPTLPFLSPSSAQHQRTNISSGTAPALIRLLKAYKPKASSVTIGVVGYPNVGKSSLINSLKRSKACAVAAQPGHTKELQSVQLERGMRIVDSPGVVFDEDDLIDKGQKKGSVLLRNVVKVEDVDDPIAVVEQILSRTAKEAIQKIYDLPDFSETLELLTMLALKSGRLFKGGTPDLLAAARQVLTDWNHQKIPYFSIPPTVHPSSIPSTINATTIAPGAENVGQAQIVNTFSKPFELEGLFGAADAGAFGDDVNMDQEDDADEMFWDANESFDMQTDETPGSRRESLKRPRSPSPQPPTPNAMQITDSERDKNVRQPKRQRKSKLVPSYDDPPDEHVLQRMGKSNPLNRKVLKREKKRERKLQRMKDRAIAAERPGGMEIDGEDLQFTFMA
ncbi:P-loop containing nucleoside triphosphate hydrolase protein [Armillaria nabsnona]|nr:P-loop containing nucleoside triphosphate hydrolase protein [Armillaria nabsnona]